MIISDLELGKTICPKSSSKCRHESECSDDACTCTITLKCEKADKDLWHNTSVDVVKFIDGKFNLKLIIKKLKEQVEKTIKRVAFETSKMICAEVCDKLERADEKICSNGGECSTDLSCDGETCSCNLTLTCKSGGKVKKDEGNVNFRSASNRQLKVKKDQGSSEDNGLADSAVSQTLLDLYNGKKSAVTHPENRVSSGSVDIAGTGNGDVTHPENRVSSGSDDIAGTGNGDVTHPENRVSSGSDDIAGTGNGDVTHPENRVLSGTVDIASDETEAGKVPAVFKNRRLKSKGKSGLDAANVNNRKDASESGNEIGPRKRDEDESDPEKAKKIGHSAG